MASVVDRKLLNQEHEPYWVSYIKQRIRKNKNFLGFISGPTGSGKSYSSLRICEMVDPEFNVDRIVFSGLQLMDLINSGKLKSGSSILFEEGGIGLSSKNWQSTTNKMLNFLMQTFRHRNYVLIMNSPFLDFMDASTRRLFHAELQTAGINFQEKTTRLKPRLLQYNSRYRKFYYHRLKVRTSLGSMPVNFWHVGLADKELIKLYEEKKQKFTDSLNEEIYSELKSVEDKKTINKNQLTNVQQDIVDMLKAGKTVPEIAKERNRAEQVVYSSIRLIKKKGFEITPVHASDHKTILRYEVSHIDDI